MLVTNLPFIKQEMTRYGMSAYLALGIIGNICNFIVFTRSEYRRMPCSIYFRCHAVFGTFYLIWSIFPALYVLYYPDPHTQSLVYCKVRIYGTHTVGQWLRYVVVFASIDRFLLTRTDTRLRRLSSVPLATKAVIVMCIVCSLIAIHLPIFMEIRGNVCGMFGLYKSVYPIYQILVVGLLPPILMIIFSVLTIRSLYQRHGTREHLRQRDQYLMRMIIAEVIANIIVTIPYSSYLVYDVITASTSGKSAERLEIEAFIYFVTLFLIYLISVTPFYVFMATSKPFRNEFIQMSVRCWGRYILGRRVQIAPVNESNSIRTRVAAN